MGNKIKNRNKKVKKIENDKNEKNEIIVEEIVKNPNLKLTEKKFPGAYCDWGLGNSFAVFTLDKQNYIIYSTENKSLIFYNLDKDLKEKEIKDAHLKEINDIKFYEKQYKNYYLIMTVSGSDGNLKIWDIKTWNCLLNLKNIYNGGNIFCSCFLIIIIKFIY